jgi:hypothetical protein
MLHNLASEPQRLPFLPYVLTTGVWHVDCAVTFVSPFHAPVDYTSLAGPNERGSSRQAVSSHAARTAK